MKHLLTILLLIVTLTSVAQLPMKPKAKTSFIKNNAPLLITAVALPPIAYLGIRYHTNTTPAMVGVCFFAGSINLHRNYNDNSYLLSIAAGIGCGLIQSFIVKPNFK